MDHSKDEELRGDVQKNRDRYQVADGCEALRISPVRSAL